MDVVWLMAEEQQIPREKLCAVFDIFSKHTQDNYEPEYTSYLYWKLASVGCKDLNDILLDAYIDYRRDRGLSRAFTWCNVTNKEKDYFHWQRRQG